MGGKRGAVGQRGWFEGEEKGNEQQPPEGNSASGTRGKGCPPPPHPPTLGCHPWLPPLRFSPRGPLTSCSEVSCYLPHQPRRPAPPPAHPTGRSGVPQTMSGSLSLHCFREYHRPGLLWTQGCIGPQESRNLRMPHPSRESNSSLRGNRCEKATNHSHLGIFIEER